MSKQGRSKECTQGLWPSNQLFLLLATLSIVFVVLKLAEGLVVPFLISIAIAILLSPLFTYLETLRIPKPVSLILITIVSLLPIVAIGGFVGNEFNDFAKNYQSIEKQFDGWLLYASHFFQNIGIDVSQESIKDALGKANFGGLLQQLVTKTGNQFSNIFLIFFTVAFLLMESQFFYNKLLKITHDRGEDIEGKMVMLEKIKTYFLIKMKTSLVTGIWAFIVLWFYDVDYALLWATLAFFLNFVPVIGSIIAAIPPIVIALLDQGTGTALWVAAWYVAINMVVGNILEPKIMGKGLGLSATTVFLSMTFWGWMFGPAGMILSVPLTMAMQFLFEQYDETRWVSLILSDYEKEKTWQK